MQIRFMMAILSVLEVAAESNAKKDVNARSSNVIVYVYFNMGDTPLAFNRAEGIASDMFSKVGVHLQWRSGAAKDEPQRIVIDVTSNTPGALSPGAMAYAQPYECTHIRIFWDRVNEAGRPSFVAPLLAHVLVHEITHVLEGGNNHSQSGVMKARWTLHDIEGMAQKPLPFDSYDVLLIRRGLTHGWNLTKAAP